MVYLPRDSATGHEQMGEASSWGPAEHMAAVQIDLLQAANWQRGGGKAKRPKSWPRPGVTNPDEKRFGNRKMTVAEYERRRQARHAKIGGEPSQSN